METVLIVEDDASLRLAMQKALRAAGYKVLVAKAGDEGLEMALSELPDCVLLDVMMPGKNGFEVLEALRSHDADLPVVMITAKGEEEDKVRGLQLGADEYVVKPVGVAELQARGVTDVRAWIAPGHTSSERVAVHVGLVATDQTDEDGERLWAVPQAPR